MNGIIKKLFAKYLHKEHTYFRSKKMACGTFPSTKDERDFKVSTKGIVKTSNKTHILSKLTPIKNQGNLQCCASCALVGTYENLVLINNPDKYLALSELYHYRNARDLNGTFPKDAGQTIRDGCKAMLNEGNAFESLFPFNPTDVNKSIPFSAKFMKNLYKIDRYDFCETITDIINLLDKDIPIVFGLKITESFYNLNIQNDVYKPKKGEREVGGHAQKAVGYDLDNMAFLIENSWGTTWGNSGYYWLPFDIYSKRAFDAVAISMDDMGYASIKRK